MTDATDTPVPAGSTPPVTLEPRNIWQIGFVLLAVVAVGLFLRFVLADAGAVLFTILMAWFAAIAIAPVVDPLSRRMRRGLATGIVMGGLALFVALFLFAFGQLFVEQVANLLKGLPDLVKGVIEWVNQRTGSTYDLQKILSNLNIQPDQVAQYAGTVLGGILGVLSSVVGGLFSMFTFALFWFYFSADGPRFRRYVASLFPQRMQPVAVSVWDVTAEKVGNYVGARAVLAFINGSTSAIVFLLIGMPSWLALAIWTGVVAQFVPTIGTYIAIALPVLVGLLSGTPWIGLAALVWALIYQQVENLTIEPKISAKAVDVHPAAAFAFVMIGTALFGVAGALLAIPVGAMILTLGDMYSKRYDVRADLATPTRSVSAPPLLHRRHRAAADSAPDVDQSEAAVPPQQPDGERNPS